MTRAALVADPERPDHYDIDITWGDPIDLPDHTDGGTIERNRVSVSYLTRLQAEPRADVGKAESALDGLLGRR